MKRIICILLILSLFVITSSCAKKGNEKDKYVEFDSALSAEDKNGNDIQHNNTEQQLTQPNENDFNSDEQNENAEIPLPNDQQDAVDKTSQATPSLPLYIEYSGDKFKAFLETTKIDVDYSYATDEQKVAHDFSEVFESKQKMSEQLITEYEYPEVNLGYAGAFKDGVAYRRYFDYANQFPAKSSKYADVDISTFEPSDKTIEIWFFLPSEIGSVYPHGSVNAQIYNLPEDMQNDPYVKMLAVRLPDGQSILLYNHEQAALYKTFGTRLESMHTHFGWQCDSADDVESIKLTKASDGKEKIISDADTLTILYEHLCKAKYTPDLERGNTKFLGLFINFKDGRRIYYSTITTTGIYDNKLKTDTEFIEYLDKLFEQ